MSGGGYNGKRDWIGIMLSRGAHLSCCDSPYSAPSLLPASPHSLHHSALTMTPPKMSPHSCLVLVGSTKYMSVAHALI